MWRVIHQQCSGLQHYTTAGSWKPRGARRIVALAFIGAVLSALSMSPGVVWAQMTTGTILGTVTDASGARVPGVKVTITNVGTGVRQTSETNSAGIYVVPTLIPGTYEVSVEKAGFHKSIETGITLQVDQKVPVNVTLQVGSTTKTVQVSGRSPMVQTQSSAPSQVVTAREMVTLPLNIRDFAQLVNLDTGAVPNYYSLGGNFNPDNPQAISDTNVNGQGTDMNEWNIDGISDNENYFNFLSVNPSIDAIQEFKVSTSNYSAEYGHAGGAEVQVAIKSGTNQFHGDAFEFLRNSKLDASDFFTNEAGAKIPRFQQNQFGGTLGGPIKKDRVFFFADYEGYRSRQGESELETIPTMLQRQGIFTEPGNPVIYNPYNIDPATGQPQPFPNNTIPASLLTDSPGAKVLALLPAPNLNVPIGQANYYGHNSVSHDINTTDGRVDYRISDKDQFFARYSFLQTFLTNPPFLGTVIGGDPFISALADTHNQNAVISETHAFNSGTLNEFRFGVNRVRTNWGAFTTQNTSDQVGIPGINNFCQVCAGLPRLTISGFNTLGASPYAPTRRHDTDFQLVDNATFIRGRHTIKIGTDLRHLSGSLYQTPNLIGEFDFDQRFTSDLGASGTGSGVASFLLGRYESAERQGEKLDPDWRTKQLFFYGQDDFRVNAKLTLNLGLRYDYYAPDAHTRYASQFDPATGDMLQLCVAIDCAGGIQPDRNDWGPRIGFAYSPDQGKTAIRSGFGISYTPEQQGFLEGYQFPKVIGQTLTPANSLTISPTDPVLSDGLPPPPPVATRPGAPPGHFISSDPTYWLDPNLPMPRIYQWSLDVERAITPTLMLDVGYVGNSGNHIQVDLPGNYPEPGVVTATGLPLQEARPYYAVDPNMTVTSKITNSGSSTYHSLQLKLQKRFSSGLSFLAAYTWSHAFNVGGNYTNPDQYMRNKSPYGPLQTLSVSYIYQLPFGRSRHWGKGWNGVTDSFLGGWEVSGITTYRSGFPFTPGITSTLDNGMGNAPNRICNGSVSNPTISHWFDPNCFVSPATNVFGNSGYNILYGPHFQDWDFATLKDFRFSESRYLQFRAEFFNLPNNVDFGNPNAFICGGFCGEGTITGLAGGYNPRQIQFALKLYF